MASKPDRLIEPVEDGVREVLRETLQLGSKANDFDMSTPLLGHVPELDSMAVASLLAAIEERFDIDLDDDDISAEVFETVGSLCSLINEKIS